ncbi:hypothetical protein, partial [Staphylococcus aureus]
MSRGLGDVYKRQEKSGNEPVVLTVGTKNVSVSVNICLLYTSDAADDSLRVDLGGRRIIKKELDGVDL